jgi:threonylcarbamoyladenosine tRNA methylthiotransferase MtaB
MRRAYPSRRYRERVERLCEQIWPLGLGTDIIVGFPGEAEEDHRRTVALVDALPFTYVHVFPYSDRQGTDAASFAERVPPRVAGERSRELRELVRRKAEGHRRRRAGTVADVVLEGDHMEIAVTGDYLKMSASDTLRVRGARLQPALVVAGEAGELRATTVTDAD